MPELSIVVSTLGNYAGLERVLDRFERQTADPGSFEVIIVVDVADPDPEAADRAIGTRPYPVHRLTGNRPGLSANRNTGTRSARAPLVLFTDNDTLGETELVAQHLAWHRRYPDEEVAVLGHVRWARELKVSPFMRWLDSGFQFDYPNIKGIEAGWGRFYGANVSVKRSFVERVGGFDEARLPYLYDDLDFGYRASKLGLRVLYNRDAVVEHLRVMDLEFWRRKMSRLARAERDFCRIHPEIPPYFHDQFASSLEQPAIRGRGRGLIGIVPRRTPWIGRRAWASADLYYRQSLAPYFLAAWEEASREDSPEGSSEAPIAPYLLESDATQPGGS